MSHPLRTDLVPYVFPLMIPEALNGCRTWTERIFPWPIPSVGHMDGSGSGSVFTIRWDPVSVEVERKVTCGRCHLGSRVTTEALGERYGARRSSRDNSLVHTGRLKGVVGEGLFVMSPTVPTL